MRSLFPAIGVYLLTLCVIPCHGDDGTNERIIALTVDLIQLARPEPGVGDEAQEIAKKLEELDHAKVVQAMLPLLRHDKEGVPYLASYVILDCESGLRPEDLELLKEGFQNGGGWLPSAIGSLDTDEAAEFLAKEFRKNPEVHGQIDSTLAMMGARAVPFLLKEFDDADLEQEEGYFQGLRHIFQGDRIHDGMKDKAGAAIPHLIAVAESENASLRRRQEAIMTIGSLGKVAMPVFPRLKALAQQDAESFEEAVTQAFIASESSAAAGALADMVEAGGDKYVVREIALLGPEAREVGPRVLGWLDDPDWEIRVMSARTLGAIGYKDATKQLEGLLSSWIDWRLAYAATKSLADLKAVESVPILEEASREHWFPIVRDAAKEAVESLQNGVELEGHGGTEAGDLVDYVFVNRDGLSIEEDELEGLEPRGGGARQAMPFYVFEKDRPAVAKRLVDFREKNGGTPLPWISGVINSPFRDGLIVGSSAGEWVGGLYDVPNEGEVWRLLNDNVHGIEKWKNRILVVSGTYHMGMNEGMIHELVWEEGEVVSKPWFVLPGSPNRMWVTEDDKLVVACIGGAVVFTDEVELRYVGAEKPKVINPIQDDEPGLLPPLGG